MHSGKPKNQSLAIAYNVMHKNRKKMASGGMVDENMGDSMDDDDEDSDMDAMDLNESLQDLSEDKRSPNLMAYGGMMHPARIAKAIQMKKLAKGGMVDDCYADGGEVGDDDIGMSDDSVNMLDDDSFSADEDDHMPHMGYPDPDDKEDPGSPMSQTDKMMKRRGVLSGIMKGLHNKHMSGKR